MKFLARRAFSPTETQEILNFSRGIGPEKLQDRSPKSPVQILERIIAANDLLDISFINKAVISSRTVGRVWISNMFNRIENYGTGFMISPSLMLTNNHVLPDAGIAAYSKLEMNYEFDNQQVLRKTDLYNLDPTTFFLTNVDLDYTIVAVNPNSAGNNHLSKYGFSPLIKEEGKAIISQWLNIIQHPSGMPKQIGIRQNQLVDVLDNFLHYKTDTAPGSSGSPVYNENWEVVGLHHSGVYQKDENGNIVSSSGGVWRSYMGEETIRWIMNEAVRISSILKHLESQNLKGRQLELSQEIQTAQPNAKMPQDRESKIMTNTDSQVNADGSVTLHIPLRVTVKLGGDIPKVLPPSVQPSAPAISPEFRDDTSEAAILEKARIELRKRSDIIDVRWGYVFRNGSITKERALVVTVPERKTVEQLRREGTSPLPKSLLGYPVEVSGPTLKQLLGMSKSFPTKETHVVQDTPTTIEYTRPLSGELKKITAEMKVIASVSPEEGWNTLQGHLEKTTKTLTVGIYDFGATFVADTIETVARNSSFKDMTMAIQVGSNVGTGTKKDDLSDADMVERLSKKLKNKFNNAWVRVGRKNGWVPSSYHIKVSVRDNKAISLSSGNWQSSNIPNLSILDNTKQTYLLNNYNRDWHVILENDEIARAYELFLKHDFENNQHNTLEGTDDSFDHDLFLMVPDFDMISTSEISRNVEPFEPFEQERIFTVTPLLSPDNYFDEIMALIQSAQSELFIQNQTFNAPGDNHDYLRELMNAVLERKNSGVDVRIIFRNLFSSDARENLERLVEMGFDFEQIKMHNKCHTKGIIVDGEKVVIGSQNWSNDGVSVNRDASLLFEDIELATYFRKIFLHDWTNVARHDIGRESASIRVASATESAPAGMIKIGWADIQETL